jgi:release factor glutamine methyltransferase
VPETPDTWTIEAVLRWTTGYFREKQLATARLDAELLLAHVLGYGRLQLYLQADRPLTESERANYRQIVRERGQGYPVAYLLGYRDFWSLRLLVAPGVLIPRPDTETLIETALNHLPQHPLRLLELGTGTGAIPLSLCAERTQLDWLCLEQSTTALQVAQQNCKEHLLLLEPRQNRLQLLQSNSFATISMTHQFDALLSNPPYIRTTEITRLSPEVSQFEPHLALDGGEDGLFWYREFLQQGPRLLRPGGLLIVEIGYDQQSTLTRLIKETEAWNLVEFCQDLQGHSRVLVAQLQVK